MILLTKHEVRAGRYRPEVLTVRTERSEGCTKKTKGRYSPITFPSKFDDKRFIARLKILRKMLRSQTGKTSQTSSA